MRSDKMVEKIKKGATELTQSQKKYLDQSIEYWLSVGRNTERINKDKVEDIITKIYYVGGFSRPEFIFVESPKSYIKEASKHKDFSINNVNYLGGNQWCYWEAFYLFCRDIGVKYQKKENELLDLWVAQATHCHWWFPYKEVCYYSDRPVDLNINDLGELHNETDMAIKYSDGWGVYSINGVRLTEWMVKTPVEDLELEKIATISNVEQRRIMINRFGVGRYLDETGAELVDMDSLTLEGSAPRALIKDKHGEKWLVGTDGSTERVYHMAVPREVTKCKEAHEAICGFSEAKLIAEA